MKRLALLLILLSFTFAQFKSFTAKEVNEKLNIDGLMDNAWGNAPVLTGFKQHEPNPLEPASERTEFRFLYDKENIYFYVTAYSENTPIVTQTGKRDQAFNNDWIIIAISPLNDGQTGYEFGVNPSNIQMDSRLYNDGWEDFNWDGVWHSETTIEKDKWTAEFKIPLRVLKFQSKDVQNWGINIIRNMRQTQEKVFWQEIDPDKGWKVSRFAVIEGLKGLKSKSEVNLVPSVVSNFDSDQDYNPIYNGSRNIGLDVRYNIDEQHSVLATFQPDFAQIEADPDQLNLSDYPVFLNEKRPFFLEGNELYSFPDEVFYTRSMARPNAGIKFFGNQKISSTEIKYGLTYVNNDGLGDSSEDFTLARAQYIPSTELQIGGFFGNVTSQDVDRLSGNLYLTDITYRPNDQFRFVGMAATTDIEGKNKSNSSLRFQMNYDSDTWYSYFRYQKKTNDFDQGLIGFPEPNNSTELNSNLGYRWRFKDSFFRQFRMNLNFNQSGTYDNSIQRNNFNFNMHASHQFESIGYVGYGAGIDYNTGEFRAYNRWNGEIGSDDDNFQGFDETNATQYDNYGYFIGGDNKGVGTWQYIESDFSKPVAGAINTWFERDRLADVSGVSLTLQLKPTNDLTFRFNTSYQDITESIYRYSSGIFRNYSFRMEYTLMDGLYAKVYTQFNPLYDRLSNNLIMSYEYERGSFMYFAYNETGLLDDNFKEGTVIENYDLVRRTISFKVTYSFYAGL